MPVTALLTALAMVAFAANSLLAREALASGAMDAVGFTGLRLASGAIALAVVLAFNRRQAAPPVPGSWASAAALLAYALAFSLAYLRLGAAMGALILFVSVQFTMIGWGVLRGERPGPAEIAGIVLALGGFVYLVSPGLTRPDPLGTVLMALSGVAWGIYSLRGRGSGDPAGDTAGNFIRTLPVALLLMAVSAAGTDMTGKGIALAVASGVLASAGGYVVWYRVLPLLAAIAAAVVQLSVPVITAAAGVLLLSEPLTFELVAAGSIILAGLALAISARTRRPR